MTPDEFVQRLITPALDADDDVVEVGDDGRGYVIVEMSNGEAFEFQVWAVRSANATSGTPEGTDT